MPHRCVFCYVTDRRQFSGNAASQRRQLLEKIAEAARVGVDFIQLREKDLTAHDLEQLACEALSVIRGCSQEAGGMRAGTCLLINSRADVALAVDADGIHMPSNDIPVHDARTVASSVRYRNSGTQASRWIISVSCHSNEDVRKAAADQADFAVFAPVFGKREAPDVQPGGLGLLREVCRHGIPVLALGGVTIENAASCLEVGAAGVAGIRLFQENDVAEVVARIRTQ